jgi:hypothetical protein
LSEEKAQPIAAAVAQANLGNLSGALKLLTQSTPLATVTKESRHKLFHYYPQQGADGGSTLVHDPTRNHSGHFLNYPTSRLKNTSAALKKEKGLDRLQASQTSCETSP